MQRKTQKRRKKGSRGAVSVFLAIILVPCIVVACIFGDISRVELSKSQAAGAADLALYALLSDFDEDLKESYGLVASSQKIDDQMKKAASYFDGMMNAKSVEGSNNGTITSYLKDAFSEDASDFLQVELLQPATVTNVGNNTLENTALFEDSVVEFMKYRAPYEMFTKFLERFRSMNLENTLTEAKKDEPIVEARKEYAKAEGEMMEKAYHTYLALRVYTDRYAQTGVPNISEYENYAKNLEKIAKDFQQVTELITIYYAASDRLERVWFPYYKLDQYVNQRGYRKEDIGKKEQVVKDPIIIVQGEDGALAPSTPPETEDKLCIDKALLQDLTRTLDTDIQSVANAAKSITDACGNLGNPGENADINPVIYCLKVQKAATSASLNTLRTKGDALMKRYAKLRAARELEEKPEGNDLPYDWKNQLNDAIRKIENAHKNYFDQGYGNASGRSAYMQLLYNYDRSGIATFTIDGVKNRSYTFQSAYLQREVTITEFLGEVQGFLSVVGTEIDAQIKALDTVINGGGFSYAGKNYSCSSLDQLSKYVKTYAQKRNSWGSAINSSGSGSDYAKKEKQEYDGEGSDKGAKLAKKIAENNGKAVSDLKTRLTNIRKDMTDYRDAVQNFTYGDQKVQNLKNVEDAIRAGKTVIPNALDQISISVSQNKADAKTYTERLVKPPAGEVYKAPALKRDEAGNDPNLDNNCTLYQLLKNQFQDDHDKIDKAVKENDKKEDKYQKEAEQKKTSALKMDTQYLKGKGESALAKIHSGNGVGALSAFTSLISVVGKLVKGDFSSIRDQMYVAEYVMDMFSYSSYNNEGQYRLARKDGKTYTAKDFEKNGFSFGSYASQWNQGMEADHDSDNKSQTPENQSLTNWRICSKNNYLNLAEVEYILYGNRTMKDNLEDSYERIFAIRETLNLVSGFQNFYSGSNTTANAIHAIATAVMAATSGVVPTAVTKCVLIAVLATCESANDVIRLKSGVPVKLYKGSDEDWCYKIGSGGDGATASFNGGDTEPKDENGLFYSDYLYFFLVMGVTGHSYDSILKRIGDLVEANMQHRGEDFQLSQAKSFFQLNAKLKVKPLLIDLPIVTNASDIDTADLKESTGWCTYSVAFTRGYS